MWIGEKKIRNNFFLFVILTIAFFLYQTTISNGSYLRDASQLVGAIEHFIKTNDFSLVENTYLFAAHPLYVIFLSFLYPIFNFISVSTFLNEVSVFFAVISIIPLFSFLNFFFKLRTVLYVTVLYIFLPFTWFHAIYASLYSMELFFVNLWVFLVLSPKKTTKKMVTSAVLLGIMTTIHLINLLLLPLFLYLIKNVKIKKILAYMFIFAVIFISSRVLFPASVGPYLEFSQSIFQSFSFHTILFTLGLGLWEIFNALTLLPIILVSVGLFYALKKKFYFVLFWMVPFILVFLPGLDIVDGFSPLFPAFILLTAFVFERIENEDLSKILLSTCIFLIFIKFFPMALDTHIYESPHETYAKFLLNISQPTTIVLSGHDCPWLYAKLTCYGVRDFNRYNLTLNGSYIITSHFFMNENRYEFLKYRETLPKFEITEYNLTIESENLCEINEIMTKHNYGDPYFYFFGISPSIQSRIFLSGRPSYNETYKVYRMC